jgi:hypothetical protein
MFAFISVAMIPVPWVFFFKGKVLRKEVTMKLVATRQNVFEVIDCYENCKG